jgi:hypothetical protein
VKGVAVANQGRSHDWLNNIFTYDKWKIIRCISTKQLYLQKLDQGLAGILVTILEDGTINA